MFVVVVDLHILALRVKIFHFNMQLIIVYLRRNDRRDTPRGTSYILYVTFLHGRISSEEGYSPSAGQ